MKTNNGKKPTRTFATAVGRALRRARQGPPRAEVDAALSNVFERVCRAIDAQPDAHTRLENPLAKLTREQLAGMRPAVVRLIASYLVLLERLKAQQLRMAGSAGAV